MPLNSKDAEQTKMQSAINEIYNQHRKSDNLLPIKVSPFFQHKIDEEICILGHREGPLHRIAYPSLEKIQPKHSVEVADFVRDEDNYPPGLLNIAIQKYHGRILIPISDNCFGHCMYCFRQHILTNNKILKQEDTVNKKSNDSESELKFEEIIDKICRYLQQNKLINEVILSGGDPLFMADHELEYCLSRFSQLSSIKNLRLHTKVLSYSPDSLTTEKINILARYHVRFVAHFAHPYEICDIVRDKIQQLQKARLRLYNQFPLLRKINDHSDVLIDLLTLLDQLHIRNLSIFFADPIYYSSAFRLSFRRICDIIQTINLETPSWINATRFVLDSQFGKVRQENLNVEQSRDGHLVFQRGKSLIQYPDLPPELDIPGQLETLLWKGPVAKDF